mmetsp:Transcript_36333/g.116693  ORF Transcript_36333/g.116693 Transcript_36333/m.116693 type:complete len:122 (-) Transcript_36333:340-705(-)|eukprot:scaffold8992_cov121-Isochrysis_galbana.AAC.2
MEGQEEARNQLEQPPRKARFSLNKICYHIFRTVSSISLSTAPSIGRMINGITASPTRVGTTDFDVAILAAPQTTRLMQTPGSAIDARPCHKRVSTASTAGLRDVTCALHAASEHTYAPAKP